MSHGRPIHTLVHGFETPDCSDAIHMLQSKGLIDIRAWVGATDICTVNIFDLFHARVPASGLQIPEKLYARLYQKRQLFDTIYSRHYVLDGVINLSSRLNIFNILARYLYDLVVRNEIELVLFSNIPHEGPDFLLYEIAQHMDIKTILCTQSRFPGKFFIVQTIEDFGSFTTSTIINNVSMQETVESLRAFEEPFFDLPGSPLSLRKRISMIKPKKPLETVLRLFRQPGNQSSVKNTLPAIQAGRTEVPSRLIARAISIFFSLLVKGYAAYEFYQYTSTLSKLTASTVDLTVPYIYFPLHLQPELTTVPLGYEYFDQALALEELHSLLPPGWKIYVKENPKQTEFMRDPYFFKRVEALDNVVWVPRDYDSRSLTQSCKILATVTGTAGLEALILRRPVVIFGSAWYKNFPNVFSFSRNVDFVSLSNALPHDKNELYNHLNHLQNMMGNGSVDADYNVLVENYSAENNCRQLFDSMQQYMLLMLLNNSENADCKEHSV